MPFTKRVFAAVPAFLLALCVPAALAVPEDNSAEKAPATLGYSFAALLQNSPFKSVIQTSAKFRGGNSTASKQIQFLGMITVDGKTEFGVFDPVAQRSYWLKLRDRNESGIYIESYNADQKSITLQSNSTGRLVLNFETPDEKPTPVLGASYRPTNVQAPTQRPSSAQQQNNNSNQRRTQRQQRR